MSSSHRGMPGCRQSLPPPIKHRAPASPSPTSSRSDAAISCVNFSLPHACSPAFAALHTVPFSYDKYEDQVDALAEKATEEFKKAVLHAKHLSKIPTGALKDKKLH